MFAVNVPRYIRVAGLLRCRAIQPVIFNMGKIVKQQYDFIGNDHVTEVPVTGKRENGAQSSRRLFINKDKTKLYLVNLDGEVLLNIRSSDDLELIIESL